jgi:hypothetical protein
MQDSSGFLVENLTFSQTLALENHQLFRYFQAGFGID